MASRNPPRFDRWQFDKSASLKSAREQARNRLGGEEILGFQVRGGGYWDKHIPFWVLDDKLFRSACVKFSHRNGRPSKWPACLYLYYRVGMSASAIGEYLGISEPAAKMQIFRAKKRLSRIFNEMQENPLLYLALVGGER